MRIEDLMTRNVQTCLANDTLEHVAHTMWSRDLGCLVVIDAQRHPIGMITDRDLAMAAYTQGVPLRNALVRSAMANKVLTCYPGTTIREVEITMQEAQIRRMPVVDNTGTVIGIVTLADIAHTAQMSRAPMNEYSGVAITLAKITQRRASRAYLAHDGESALHSS